ncbi:MAG TPA: 2-phospho-L-lactate transferase [Anaerolineales bacterium]|jgi:LPPG:FO 2-phospho-L-lactate transferase|nr:2-phospho-L-lactate transferase [Anaerolineales bacterium]
MDLGSVVALAGGVGGAKMAQGLAAALGPGRLTVVVNTADDFEHLSLHISPDLDTVMYTLAGLQNAETGWGLADESWHFLEALERLGGETWFRLGDRDLGTHVERTRRQRAGEKLSSITEGFCTRLGVAARVLPMSDDPVRTVVHTDAGPIPFQEYFALRKCRPAVRGFEFEGADAAEFHPSAAAALQAGDLSAVLICPSNPYVSIAPILALTGAREYLRTTAAPVIAISPIVGGAALKGPAAKMMRELGENVSAETVAVQYADLLDGFVLDRCDAAEAEAIRARGMRVLLADTVMRTSADEARLAAEILAFAGEFARARVRV